jgi:hypothetical protein
MTSTYKWHEFYNAAVLETDWSQMDARIQAAERALKERLYQFSLNHGGTPEENQAIVDCLNNLNILRADLASWRQSTSAVESGPEAG